MVGVTSNEFKEIMETTPSAVITQLRTYLPVLVNAVAAEPSYTGVNYLDNIGVTKATPKNGILTFNFALKGITVTIAYRDD